MAKTREADIDAAARRVLAYLAETDPLPAVPVDAVIGFGVFDLTLPQFCAELYLAGHARRIVFTGGVGAGTGDLGGPEADVWHATVRHTHPTVPADAFIVENRSRNTAENIRFTAELLASGHPELAFGRGLKTALLVASPSRLRRVRLTMLQLVPTVTTARVLPSVDFDRERDLYTRQGVGYIEHLIGELDRLVAYPARGWIAPEPLPNDIRAAGEVLKETLAASQTGCLRRPRRF